MAINFNPKIGTKTLPSLDLYPSGTLPGNYESNADGAQGNLVYSERSFVTLLEGNGSPLPYLTIQTDLLNASNQRPYNYNCLIIEGTIQYVPIVGLTTGDFPQNIRFRHSYTKSWEGAFSVKEDSDIEFNIVNIAPPTNIESTSPTETLLVVSSFGEDNNPITYDTSTDTYSAALSITADFRVIVKGTYIFM
jgi:hypothetical protein